MNICQRFISANLLALGLLFSSAALSAPFFRQAPLKTPLLSTSAVFPVTDANQYLYDNFTLNQTSTLSRITWRGGYNGSPGTVKGFIVSIYAINFPLTPDTPAAQSGLVARYKVNGIAHETAVPSPPLGLALFNYWLRLRTPLVLNAGQKYWISIVAKQDMTSQWGWATAGVDHNGQSLTGSDSALTFVKGSARWFNSSNNYAFTLSP